MPTGEIIEELELQLKALSSGKNLHTSVQKKNLPEFLFINKELLLRGIVNVLANAAEHTPPQGSIGLLVQGSADTVHFMITDTGRGFSQADLKEATHQFYRGDGSRSSGNHHGMGLYIARSVAEQHGGSLSLIMYPLRRREGDPEHFTNQAALILLERIRLLGLIPFSRQPPVKCTFSYTPE